MSQEVLAAHLLHHRLVHVLVALVVHALLQLGKGIVQLSPLANPETRLSVRQQLCGRCGVVPTSPNAQLKQGSDRTCSGTLTLYSLPSAWPVSPAAKGGG